MVATGVREPVEALGLGMAYLVISRDLCQCTWHRRDDEAATETTGEDPREAARTGHQRVLSAGGGFLTYNSVWVYLRYASTGVPMVSPS